MEENTIIHDTHYQETHSEISERESVCADTETSSLEEPQHFERKCVYADTERSSLKELQHSKIDELCRWAAECNIQQNHLDKLLAILRKKLIPALPQSSTTFLRTSEAEYKIVDMEDNNRVHSNGQFVYFGLRTKLQENINSEFYHL